MGTCCVSEDPYTIIPTEILELSKHRCEYELNDSCSVTFYPSPHLKKSDYGTDILQHELFTSSSRLHNVLSEIKCNNLISCNDDDLMIIQQESKINPFIECAVKAWSDHYPLCISPQVIWLLILQSISIYNNGNNDKCEFLKESKSKFDKIRLSALPSQCTTSKNYDYSTTGTINNKEWIVKMKEFLGILETDFILNEETNDLLSSLSFTSSTYLDEMSSKLCSMNILNNSYEYDESTECGFPSITLKGKKDDWLNLRDKTISILDKKCNKQFNRDWSESLLPILDRFIAVYDGEIDCVFWNSMIKRGAMNGSKGEVQWYSGWINCFFPTLNGHENQWCEPYAFDIGYIQSGLKNDDKYGGIEVNSFPIGLCHADAVIINDINTPEASPEDNNNNNKLDGGTPTISDAISNNHEENIKIVSGFIGYTQNQLNYSLSPMVGWFVVSNTAQNRNNGYDPQLQGISEDDDDINHAMHAGHDYDDDIDDDADSDGLRLINTNNSSNAHIKPSDDEEDEHDDDDDNNYGKKKKKGKEFMPIDVIDDEDDVQKEMHKHTNKK